MSIRISYKTLLHFSFIMISVVWLFYLFADTLNQTGWLGFMPDNWILLGIATCLLITYLLFIGLNFHIFLFAASSRRVPLKISMRLHLVGQVARYLPGRFWGIAYQISTSKAHVSATTITRANIDLMALSLIGTTFISVIILGVYKALSVTLTIIIISSLAALVILLIKLFSNNFYLFGSTSLQHILDQYLPQRISSFLKALGESRLTLANIIASMSVFMIGWGLYLLAWAALGGSFQILADSNMAILCSCYTLAWMIGFISAVTPGGIGVRETAFVLIAGHVASPEILAFIAIFIRAWLMFADMFLVLLIPIFINR